MRSTIDTADRGQLNSVEIGIRNNPKTVYTIGVTLTAFPTVQANTTPDARENNFGGFFNEDNADSGSASALRSPHLAKI